MTEGLFVNLITTGRSPLYSQIRSVITVDLCRGSSFDVCEERLDTLEDERLALTGLCSKLTPRTLVYNDPLSLSYLKDCCSQYSLAFAPADILPLSDCIDDLAGMGLDLRMCMADVPRYTGELKHFYKDYKNYYYLPAEDQAYHRSVSGFVDRSARVPATARTAYTKKTGTFIPVYDASLVNPNVLFRRSFDDAVSYTLPQYLDLNNPKVIASYMWCRHIHQDA